MFGIIHQFEKGSVFIILQATLETTVGNSNPARFQYIQAESVLEGIRTMAANRLASTGMEWGSQFEKFNSGT